MSKQRLALRSLTSFVWVCLAAGGIPSHSAPPSESAGWVPAQTFLMGDATGDGRADERPVHPVTLSRFYLSPFLVTAQQYCDFLNASGWTTEDDAFIVPKGTKAGGDRAWGTLVNLPYAPIEKKDGKYVPKTGLARKPMYYVTWEGAALYCNWLSLQQNLAPCYRPDQNWACDLFAGGYHLPTEAQWEGAARGGQPTRVYPWGDRLDPRRANYGNNLGQIAGVGTYPPNDYGLHDLAGNVMEWCHDWYQFEYYSHCESGLKNPSGPPDVATDVMQMRALRGGMYYHPPEFHTCARRYGTSDTKGCYTFNGFRFAREDPETVADRAALKPCSEGSAAEMKIAADWYARAFEGNTVPFSFTLDGQPSSHFLHTWQLTRADGPANPGKKVRTLVARDPDSGLEIGCEVTTFDQFPAVDWVLRLTHRGSRDTPILEHVRVLDWAFERSPSERREFILRHSRGSRATLLDFVPTDDLLPPLSKFKFGGHGGRSSDYDFPFLNLQWGAGGVALAMGWTGQWQATFERDRARGLQVKAGMEYTRLRLQPGESIRTPRLLLCFWDAEDMLRGHNLFRQLILAHYHPRIDGQLVRPLISQSAAGLNGYTEQNQLDAVPKLKERGVEVQWIDAGWFIGGWPNGAGTWAPRPECFPRGFGPVGDAVHAAGLKFLVWFEIERVSRGSRIAREHPEWVIGPITEYGGLFNWGIPQARQWMVELVSDQIAQGKIDIFRQDMNMEPLGYWRRNDPPDRQGITEIRFVEGMYDIWDELRARHPGLWIDNCASGGRLIDLETSLRSIPLWQSDVQCVRFPAEAGQLQNHGLNLYLPMHCGGMGCADGTLEPSYGFRSNMMTGNPQAFDVNAPPDQVRGTVDLYHRARPFFEGNYYPLFPPSPALNRWFGYQLHRADLAQGMVMVFRRAQCPLPTTTVILRALEPNASYRLTDKDSGQVRVINESDLRMLAVKVESTPGSRLLFYEKVQP